jgi:Na+/H+ antiporter NhaD/arsenite permease-like protein
MNFGWKAALAIGTSTTLVYLYFRREFGALEMERKRRGEAGQKEGRAVPGWVTAVHLAFIGWTVFMAHYPVFFVGGFLFFLAFAQATAHHQKPVDMRSPLLVGFFLAGLVVHGGQQGWWIGPVLGSLDRLPLYFGALVLTAFNDNAAITYLATLVPNFSEGHRYAVVAGAVAGGGLTVIANAPNPAGQAVLKKYFPEGISPLGLFLGALVPTVVATLCFLCL